VSPLLDTHVLIWWDEGQRRSWEARRAISDAQEVFDSAIPAWEVATEIALGRPNLPIQLLNSAGNCIECARACNYRDRT
jgi:PIN domain nuclease of toxin-antitoxin system